MERIQFIPYKGKLILLEDFTNLKPGPEFWNALDLAQKKIAQQPEHSVLALFDATGASYDTETMARLKAFVQANSPYIQCSVVVGIKGLLGIALNSVSNAAKRPIHECETRQQGLEYLASLS